MPTLRTPDERTQDRRDFELFKKYVRFDHPVESEGMNQKKLEKIISETESFPLLQRAAKIENQPQSYYQSLLSNKNSYLIFPQLLKNKSMTRNNYAYLILKNNRYLPQNYINFLIDEKKISPLLPALYVSSSYDAMELIRNGNNIVLFNKEFLYKEDLALSVRSKNLYNDKHATESFKNLVNTVSVFQKYELMKQGKDEKKKSVLTTTNSNSIKNIDAKNDLRLSALFENADDGTLLKLIEEDNITYSALLRSELSENILQRLVQEKDVYTQLLIARHPSSSRKILDQLIDDRNVQLIAQTHVEYGEDRVLNLLNSDDKDDIVSACLNPCLPNEYMLDIITDDDFEKRLAVMNNPTTPEVYKILMRTDEDEE